jgi:4-diphosphocytidyl-2-C-methyl-D-erythritol kinase
MRWQRASAKVNLTLRVVGRRADGYHDLESLVAFAGLCDWLAFDPGDDLTVEVLGSRASEAGPVDENLVVRAARSLAAQLPGLKLGRFRLVKHLPAAAGLGGGSADAAAALRLLAEEAGLSVDDPRVHASARATGADVLVCLSPQARMMRGIGDRNWRQTRSGHSASKIVCASRQSPSSGADA